MSEKTVEELQAELESLKKARLEREVAAERAIVEAEELKKEEEQKEALRQEGYEKAMTEMSEKSKVVKEKPETLEKKTKLLTFGKNHVEKYDLTGLEYEDLIKSICEIGKENTIKKARESRKVN